MSWKCVFIVTVVITMLLPRTINSTEAAEPSPMPSPTDPVPKQTDPGPGGAGRFVAVSVGQHGHAHCGWRLPVWRADAEGRQNSMSHAARPVFVFEEIEAG
jgi:hypothetical protein